MLENVIVGVIILAAAAFAVYRLFLRPSCGCGSNCGCSGHNDPKKTANGSGCCCGSNTDQCQCGK